jgi:hypothetical protein
MLQNNAIGDIIAGALIGALVVAIGFVSALLGTLVGVVVGWIVGITPLGDIILVTFYAAGIEGITMVNIGATIGFIGGFLTTTVKVDKNK